MGERHSGDGLPGRRHAHPGGVLEGPEDADGDAGFEAAVAAVLRPGGVDRTAEERAVAAFRAARDSGALRTRTRRRDDWRPGRRAALPPRITLSVVLASLTLGGVAFAAVGSDGPQKHADGGERRAARPAVSAPRQPDTESAPTTPGARPSRPGHPATARDTLAHCRAYERVGGRGTALDATAWQRLVTAAGGEDEVAAYCAARTTPTHGPGTGSTGGEGKTGESGNNGNSGNSNTGNAGSTGNAGNTGEAGKAGGSGRAGGGAAGKK
ncbi:hypothetical protein GCM10010503_02870 [Streptomyces lucensis JCM 4490]|uniref:Uncharacterized protein n=1 Tax=Streptomyces lucensis JCM 4490 TaxID=1306176 RepID=A0A918IU53_9ACTN|nr:hypothetical protein [Streptomyces lucensis]GGW30690.1 hypothetical protein GCM10010503_02870 [Streptomyces lucensis JCM 4490]